MGKIINRHLLINSKNPGKYSQIKSIFIEASHLNYGLKWPLFKRLLLISIVFSLIFFLPASLLLASYLHFGWSHFLFVTLSYCLSFIAITLSMMLWLPILMMGVRQAIGSSINLQNITAQCLKEKSTLFKLLLIYALIMNGYFFGILHSPSQGLVYNIIFHFIWNMLFLVILTPFIIFAFPLVITRKLTLYEALESAFIKTRLHWTEVLGSQVILWSIAFAAGWLFIISRWYQSKFLLIITFIMMIMIKFWILLMLTTTGGVLFRNIYGLNNKEEETTQP